jgi:hypothetical protein
MLASCCCSADVVSFFSSPFLYASVLEVPSTMLFRHSRFNLFLCVSFFGEAKSLEKFFHPRRENLCEAFENSSEGLKNFFSQEFVRSILLLIAIVCDDLFIAISLNHLAERTPK